MASPFHTVRRVEFRDTDAAGIMHFSTFFNKMEEAEHELLRSLGTSVITYDEQGKISWPRVAVSCDYARPVKFEDQLDIAVTIERMGRTSVTYAFSFSCRNEPVATGRMTVVHCRVPHDTTPIPAPIPEDLRVKLAEFTDPKAS